MVPKAGLEPAHREAQASETCVSTNSTTWALQRGAQKMDLPGSGKS